MRYSYKTSRSFVAKKGRISRKPPLRKKEKEDSYMDNKSPSKKESKEVTRESLIAISNCLPDKILESKSVSESKKSDVALMPNRDQDDKFRSELISISYAESPDAKI